MKNPARSTFSQLTRAARRLRSQPRPRPTITFRCPQAWESMVSVDEEAGIRHCGLCKQNVYDLLGKTDEEIRAAILGSGGELCGQVMVRRDGRVVAGECRGGQHRIRRGRIAYRKP